MQNVLAFTTTRLHPQQDLITNKDSKTPYDHFNIGEHVGDNIDDVKNNRNVLLEFLPSNSNIQWLEQIHGADVLLIKKKSNETLIADAMITREKNIALAIMTADCLPILLTAKDGSEIAAIHGGWKPLAKNIIANTVSKMLSANEDIIAWLGPCIGKLAFEIGEEVKLTFENQSKAFTAAFTPLNAPLALQNEKTDIKYLANLAMIAKLQLNAIGIDNIRHLNHCTYSDKQQYYSFRRDNITGRMASVICRV
jgi:YfiH family protein